MTTLSTFLTALAHIEPSSLTAALREGVETAGGNLTGLSWTGTIGSIFSEIAGQIRPIFAGIAILMISIAGIRMAIGQEDEPTTVAKHTVLLAVVGLILAYSTTIFYNAFYQGGAVPRGAAAAGAGVLSGFILETVNLLAGIVYPIALLGVFISVIQALLGPTEENATNMRRALFASFAGLTVYVAREAIALVAGTSGYANIHPLAEKIVFIANIFLGAATVAAGLMIVIAALQLVSGLEDQYTKAKGLIIRVIIGYIIVLNAVLIFNAMVQIYGS